MRRCSLPVTLTVLLLGGFALTAEEPPEVELEFARKLREKKLPQYALEVLEKLNKNPPAAIAKTLPLELARTRVVVARLQDLEAREGALLAAYAGLDPLAKTATPEGAEAVLERARVTFLLAQTAVQLARQAEGEGKYARAEKYVRDAQKEYAEAEKVLAKPRDKFQARFERGLVVYEESGLYNDAKPASKRKKAEILNDVRKIFQGALKEFGADETNPTVYLLKAWLARACREGGDRNASDKYYKELLAETRPEAADGKRWAKAFLVVSIPLDKNGIQLAQKDATAWLDTYSAYRDAPEGALVRYQLATAYYLAAQAISKDLQNPEAGKLYDKAQQEFAAVGLLDSELSTRSMDLALNLRFQRIGEKTPLSSINDFDGCYLKGRYEMGRLQEIQARQANAKTKEERDQLEATRQEQVQACIAAYERALQVADKTASAKRLAEIHFLLAYCYMAHGDTEKALDASETLARATPPTKSSAAAAAYAFDVCAVLMARDNSPKTRARVRSLAQFVLKDRQPLWQNDPVTQTAHYQLAMVALGEKKYAESVAELQQLRPEFRNYFYSRCQLVFVLLAARNDAKSARVKKHFTVDFMDALNNLPPLPARPEPEAAGLFFSAQIEHGNLLLEEAAGLAEAKKMPEARAKYNAVVQLSEQARKQTAKVYDVLAEDIRGRIGRALQDLKLLGELGILRIEYREGHFDTVLKDTAPFLKELFDQAKDEKSTAPIKVSDSRLAGEAVGLALRAQVQKGNGPEARKLVLLLRRLTDERGGEGLVTVVLGEVVQELKTQMQEQKGNKEALQSTILKFGDFLEMLGKEVDPKVLGDRQFVIFLATSYANLDKHVEAAKLFAQVKPPSVDPKKKMDAKEQREMQDYWIIQAMYGRELRLAKQLPEARKVLQAVLKDPRSTVKFQVEKEMIHLLEDENEWGAAVTAWSEYMEHPGLRATMLDPKAKPADIQYAKELYFDGFYHYILSNYKYGATSKSEETRKQYVAKAAALIRGLENHKNQEGWRLIGTQLQELLRNEPQLKAAYEKLK